MARTPRFTEIGNKYYQKSWVFLFNETPLGYITNTAIKSTVTALVDRLQEIDQNENVRFHFESVLNENLAMYLQNRGVRRSQASILSLRATIRRIFSLS